jgi:hypothetical protein
MSASTSTFDEEMFLNVRQVVEDVVSLAAARVDVEAEALVIWAKYLEPEVHPEDVKSDPRFYELTNSEEHLVLKQHYRELYNALVRSTGDELTTIPLHPDIAYLPSVVEIDGNYQPSFLEMSVGISRLDLSKFKKGTGNGTYLCPEPKPAKIEVKKEKSQARKRPKVTGNIVNKRPKMAAAPSDPCLTQTLTVDLERINLSSLIQVREGTYLVTKGQVSGDNSLKKRKESTFNKRPKLEVKVEEGDNSSPRYPLSTCDLCSDFLPTRNTHVHRHLANRHNIQCQEERKKHIIRV